MVCSCGPQNQTFISTGGLRITGESTTGGIPYRTGPQLLIGGSCVNDIRNRFNFGYHHLLHLQEEESPYQNDGTGNDAIAVEDYAPTCVKGLYGGYCQQFDNEQRLTITSDSIDLDQPFTFSVWVALDELYEQRTIFGTDTFTIGHNVLSQFQLSTTFDGDEEPTFATSTTLNRDDCWHYLTVVYQPNEYIKVYADGDLERTKIITDSINDSTTSEIGSWAESYLIGRLQELRLQQKILKDWEVEYLYANGCGRGNTYTGWETPSGGN